MKMKLVSLTLIMFVTLGYSQNRYETTMPLAKYTPRSIDDIVLETKALNSELNRAIPNLIRQCNQILDDKNFCTDELRKKILPIKEQLEYVNYQAKNDFISIYDANNIYQKCDRQLNKIMRKHNKALDKQLQKKYKSQK